MNNEDVVLPAEVSYGDLAQNLRSGPWAIEPEWLAKLAAAPHAIRRGFGGRPTQARGAIAVLGLYGITTPAGRGDGGDTSTNDFVAAVTHAARDPDIAGILLDIASPGGSVYGAQEAADALYSVRRIKPVYAVANCLAASAAYWIGSQATELFVTPSGEVGSVGVYLAHVDLSGRMKQLGVKSTLISAGRFKTEGNSLEPLSKEARSTMQASVDGYYATFIAAVARGRGVGVDTVRSGMGKGRVLGASRALDQRMVDGIGTRAQVIDRLQRHLRGEPATSPAATARAQTLAVAAIEAARARPLH